MISEADNESTSPRVDMAAWRRLAMRALEGRPFETLISRTFEGLEIQPLYERAMAEAPRAFRYQPGPWRIAQRIDHPDPEAANLMARTDLGGGADALTLVIAGAPTARGFGTAIHGMADLDTTLRGIDLDRVAMRVDAGILCLDMADHLRSLAHEKRLTSAALDIDLGYDPIGAFARSGTLSRAPGTIGHDGATKSRLLRGSGFSGHLFLAEGRPYHEAGAGEAQELACVLATGVAYLRLLEGNGVGLEEARDDIAFLLTADADEFLTLAKFRALRRLWAHVESACGLTPKPIRLHGETAFRMMTRYDPHVNILRAAIALFSAAIGGADTITVLPYSLALGLPDEAARRLARNTHLVLIHEANLAKVVDPAAGSGAFEGLTEALCRHAWAVFQRFEQQGGMIASLAAGLPQALIAEAAAARRAAIARRSLAVTGTSAFPDLAEASVQVLEPFRNASDMPPARVAATCPALPAQRDAEAFERLRAASDESFVQTGSRPRVFIVSLGLAAPSTAIGEFARNLFAVAGIEAVACSGSGTADEVAAAFSRSGCKIACICASRPVARETAAQHLATLQAAGAAGIYLVGIDHEIAAGLQHAESVEIISEGCDVIAILRRAIARALPRSP